MDSVDDGRAGCIGALEHHLHQLFSAARVPGDDFVYSASADIFNHLEEYCSETTFHEPRAPLLILGESGCGKSAMLANWLQRKQMKAAHGRKHSDEFIFWHAVGCSRQSMNVNSLIRRLMHDLKDRFDLVRDVPIAADRLSWELPRFFEMASKKGHIIIVIDGIHRLLTNEDKEAGLAWLPVEFPPNVRIILTATSPTDFPIGGSYGLFDTASLASDLMKTPTLDGARRPTNIPNMVDDDNNSISSNSMILNTHAKGAKILAELHRRKWRPVRVKRMDRSQCRNAVESFIWKSVQKETISFAAGPFLTQGLDEFSQFNVSQATNAPISVPFGGDKPTLDSAPGFLLFDTQIAKLLSHSQGGTPLFLRLILQCSHYAVGRGFSLWALWEDWLKADSVSSLVMRILHTIETGHNPTSSSVANNRQATEDAGSLQTLKLLYPWHPSFQDEDNAEEDPDDYGSLEKDVKDKKSSTSIVSPNRGEGGFKISEAVNENLGDQQWLALGGFAETVLSRTRKQITDSVTMQMQQANSIANMELIAKQNAAKEKKMKSRLSMFKGAVKSIQSIVQQDSGNAEVGCLDMVEATLRIFEQNLRENEEEARLAAVSFSEKKDDISAITQKSHEAFSEKGLVSSVIEEVTLYPSGSRPTTSESATAFEASAAVEEKTELDRAMSSATGFSAISANDDSKTKPPVSSRAKGIDTLPLYLLGGQDVMGLGNILGNALALLYVARHGLKENEIWGLLAALYRMERQEQIQRQSQEAFELGKASSVDWLAPDQGESTALIQIAYIARGMMEDLCRSEDLAHTGSITRGQLSNVMRKLHDGLSYTDSLRLLEVTSLLVEDRTQLSENIPVNYMELLRRVTKVYESNQRHKAEGGSMASYESIQKETKTKTKLDKKDNQKEDFAASMGNNVNSPQNSGIFESEDEFETLGPILEESLLKVLIALGVLHSPENQVLLLPSDNDLLREVVFQQYVQGRGGESVWHGHLINHFQSENNSMRRCEELPWHLQICRRWHNMKDALVDLSTFQMMYDSTDLRDEFMSYWVTLTEGPMYTSDDFHRTSIATRAKQVDEVLRGDRSRDPELAEVLIKLDTSAALGLSEKQTRKMLMNNQVAPFDVIEEFNKSVELWVARTKPSVEVISEKILHIGRFFAEFSTKGASQPPFLRLGVSMKALELFDVNFEAVLKDLKPTNDEEESGAKTLALGDVVAEEEEEGKKVDEKFPTAKHVQGGKIYFFLRWIWVQFPWLALNNTVEVGSVCNGGLASVLAAYAAGARGRGRAGPKEITNTGGEGGANDLASIENGESTGDMKGAAGSMSAKNAAIARSTRLWDVKKNDPTIHVIHNSDSRKNAGIKTVLMDQKVSDVMDLTLRRVRDDIANASAAKNKMPQRYRRTMEQELEAMKGIPHAHHCKRSMNRNTLFPSLDQAIKEKNKKIEEDGELYQNALATMRLGGQGLPLESGLEADLKILAYVLILIILSFALYGFMGYLYLSIPWLS